jgi:SanA protein
MKLSRTFRRFPLRRVLRWLAGLVGAGLLFVWWTHLAASWAARGRLYGDSAAVPAVEVAVVLGTSDRIQGRENLYFRHRIDAAVDLWEAGKVRTLLVSGDNRSRYYNEPLKMRQALIARGVPADRIVCDYAGLRTLDSVVRAKEVFSADRVLFISQSFHNERAIYLARAHGIDAIGFNARDVDGRTGFKTRLREVGARVKMWLDVHITRTRPRHLGDKVPLPP